jgi:hypothetical protein
MSSTHEVAAEHTHELLPEFQVCEVVLHLAIAPAQRR